MKKTLLFSFISFFIFPNAQAVDLGYDEVSGTPKKKHIIDPQHNLFKKEEQFSVSGKNDIILKVSFSEPIYKEVQCIHFGESLDSTKNPTFIKILMKNSTFFDILSDGEYVGKVKTDIMPDTLNQVYIRKIKVDEKRRGKGIGAKAIGLVVQFYLQKGFEVDYFCAQIKTDNNASIRIFEKNGFLTNRQPSFGLLSYFLKV